MWGQDRQALPQTHCVILAGYPLPLASQFPHGYYGGACVLGPLGLPGRGSSSS